MTEDEIMVLVQDYAEKIMYSTEGDTASIKIYASRLLELVNKIDGKGGDYSK